MSNFNVSDVREPSARYDRFTITLHWLTALLVVALFALAQTWGFLQRGTPPRLALIHTHISLGILLAAVIIMRVVWRLLTHRRMPPAVSGFQHVVATVVHLILYALLISQASYGLLLGWAAGKGASFFGLFTIPSLIVLDHDTRHVIGRLHDYTAWAIMAFAGVHAAAALMHHYVLRDRVLVRMMPAGGERRSLKSA
jgi:cytochrome b561